MNSVAFHCCDCRGVVVTVPASDSLEVAPEEIARANAHGAAHVAVCANRNGWEAFAEVTGDTYQPFYPAQPDTPGDLS